MSSALITNLQKMLLMCLILLQFLLNLGYAEDPDTTTRLGNADFGFETRNGNTKLNIHRNRSGRQVISEKNTTDCMRFTSCPAFHRILETNRTDDPDVHRVLRDSACSDSERKDMIFCSKVAKFLENTIVRLPYQCGQLSWIPKMYGGKKTELDEFNWVALLKYKNNKNKNGQVSYRCHGSLVSDKLIVTAAHCLDDSLHSVVLGEYEINSFNDCIHGECADPIQEFSIKSYRKHPQYQPRGALNDIGLVWLNGTAKFSANNVGPICLPVDITPLSNQEPLFISGWGTTETGNMSDFKLKAQVSLLAKSKCVEQRLRYHTPDETMLCAGSNRNVDICAGDSGGPLMAVRMTDGDINRMFLAGVISLGGHCGLGIGVYTNVTHFTDWIQQNMVE